MISRTSGSWQTTMADLALILFIVIAAGLTTQGDRPEPAPTLPDAGEPLAIYSDGASALSLSEWLADQAPDQRQQLSIIVRYRTGEAEAASSKALEMVRQSGPDGLSARIVLEEGAASEALAVLAFDRSQERMAQTLQQRGHQD